MILVKAGSCETVESEKLSKHLVSIRKVLRQRGEKKNKGKKNGNINDLSKSCSEKSALSVSWCQRLFFVGFA